MIEDISKTAKTPVKQRRLKRHSIPLDHLEILAEHQPQLDQYSALRPGGNSSGKLTGIRLKSVPEGLEPPNAGSQKELKEDKHAIQLKRAFDIISKLPAGEVERLADTAEKKLKKWPEDILKEAPELFQERPRNEEVPEFLNRVYRVPGHLNGNLTTAHFDVIDPPLATAVRSWIRNKAPLPADIIVPKKVERPTGMKYKKSKP